MHLAPFIISIRGGILVFLIYKGSRCDSKSYSSSSKVTVLEQLSLSLLDVFLITHTVHFTSDSSSHQKCVGFSYQAILQDIHWMYYKLSQF